MCVFSVWCISLSKMSSMSGCSWQNIICSRHWIISAHMCVHHISFLCSCAARQGGCFHIWAIRNNAAMNLGVQIFFSRSCFFLHIWVYPVTSVQFFPVVIVVLFISSNFIFSNKYCYILWNDRVILLPFENYLPNVWVYIVFDFQLFFQIEMQCIKKISYFSSQLIQRYVLCLETNLAIEFLKEIVYVIFLICHIDF